VFERINEVLRRQVHTEAGKDEEPSVAILDGQFGKTAEKGGLRQQRHEWLRCWEEYERTKTAHSA